MNAQDRSLQQYQQLLQLNAASHLIRMARQFGIFDALAEGQKTAEQLIERCGLRPSATIQFLDALRATGVIEKYGDDYALAQVTRLLCEYDADLGDTTWERFAEMLKAPVEARPQLYHNATAATQWTHTRTAMEAAEMLGIGQERKAPRILDLACGSAVWSCAMAYRDDQSTLTAVDHAAALQAAAATAEAVQLGSRYQAIESDPIAADLPAEAFDLAVIAQRLHSEQAEHGQRWLRRIYDSLADGGEVVVIDLFTTTGPPKLGEVLEAMKLEIFTDAGAVRDPQVTERQLAEAGFTKPQFSYLPASAVNFGLMVAKKEGPT